MNGQIEIQINLYGIFREYAQDLKVNKYVLLQFANPSSISAIKLALHHLLEKSCPKYHAELIQLSVLANHENILDDNHIICESTQLAIIPPVCGG